MTTVAVLGSTGSIGTQTIDVVEQSGGAYEITAIGAARNVDLLVEQAKAIRPRVVAIADESRAAELRERVPPGTEVIAGPSALADVADADVVVNGVVGFAGLPVTLAALERGKRLALANKESLIAAGPIVRAVRTGEIVPVDSEHSAVHQCLRAGNLDEVERIVLTASGGPFRGRSRAELEHVSIDDALAHPTWSMGPKITVDSSTLMNKGLEVIEANELFGVGYDRIEVVVHPQSIVHSMVTFTDGATIAQLSQPDMRLPIEYALGHPVRGTVPFGRLDWSTATTLEFAPPDTDAFPCLRLAYEAGRAGDSFPAWLNAANEIAVEAFLAGRIGWLAIAEVLKEALDRHNGTVLTGPDVVLAVDREARVAAAAIIERKRAA
jgi:1-deoxy-D-xylulose-5-phosphate reductoisomerase